MGFRVRNTKLSKFVPICLCLVASLAGAADYSFTQSGFSGGGVISGSFSGVDANGDGQISSFSNEVSGFSLTFSGDTIVGSFAHSLTDLNSGGLVYTVGGTTLGSVPTGGTEGLASNWFNASAGFSYASGLGPTNNLGGFAKDIATGATSSTTQLIQVTAVPEPESYAMLLAGLGLVGAIAGRRRKQPA